MTRYRDLLSAILQAVALHRRKGQQHSVLPLPKGGYRVVVGYDPWAEFVTVDFTWKIQK